MRGCKKQNDFWPFQKLGMLGNFKLNGVIKMWEFDKN